MTITGSIKSLKARIDVSDNLVQVIQLEVYGDLNELHAMMKKSLTITLEEKK